MQASNDSCPEIARAVQEPDQYISNHAKQTVSRMLRLQLETYKYREVENGRYLRDVSKVRIKRPTCRFMSLGWSTIRQWRSHIATSGAIGRCIFGPAKIYESVLYRER